MTTTDALYVLFALVFTLIIATLFLAARLSAASPVNDDEEPTLNTRTSKD